MAETMNNQDNKADELDLMVLLESVVKFIRNYGRLMIIALMVGLLGGVITYFSMPKSYTSKLILHSVILTNLEQIEIIDNWSDLLKKGDKNGVANDFNIDPAIVKKLYSITGTEIQKSFGQNNPNGFIVEVIVGDTGALSSLQRGIVYGLENTDYIKARVATRRQNFTELIGKVKSEIGKLDSTKRIIENSISGKVKNSSTFIVDVSSINVQMVQLNEKLLQYEEELRFVSAIQVVKGFSKFERPNKTARSMILFGAIGGIGIGLLASVYMHLKTVLAARKI